MENYSLNKATLDFINKEISLIDEDKVYTTAQLELLFKASPYYDYRVENFYPTAIRKSLSFAIKRSKYWTSLGINRHQKKKVKIIHLLKFKVKQ